MARSNATALEIPATRVAMYAAAPDVVFLATMAALVVGAVAGALLGPWFLAARGLSVMVILVASLGAIAVNAVRRPRVPGTLRIDDEALSWNGAPLLTRGKLREAIAYTNGTKHGVRLRARFRTQFFELSTREEADRVVAALGKDSSQAALSFGAEGFVAVAFWYSAFQAFSSFGLALQIALSALVVFVLPKILMRFTATTWLVGSDGLLVRRGLGKGRFISYAEVREIRAVLSTVSLTLADSSLLRLKSKNDSKETRRPVVGASALAARIQQAKANAAERGASGDIASELARGERPVNAWLQELRGLLDRPASYRVAAVPRERLWSALEDVTQPAEVRAAAAAALRPRLAEEERPRLRVAAAACASPQLRVAFEAAEEADDEELEEALSAVAAVAKKA